jgi:uncharacterized protein YndB with AHSA1/START domain
MADPSGPVEVSMVIAARPETIFRYFTDPARFARWMGQASVLDPEPGGRLRVGYPTGQVAGGRVVAVEPDRWIIFSWGYEGHGQAAPAGSSTVEITLEPVAGGTEVRLRHSGLPAGEPPVAHRAGWRHALATLAYAGSADQLGPVLGELVADWLAGRGAPEPCHGLVRFGWAAGGPDETVLATGTNVAETDLDGRFRWVTGFWDAAPDRPEPAERS